MMIAWFNPEYFRMLYTSPAKEEHSIQIHGTAGWGAWSEWIQEPELGCMAKRFHSMAQRDRNLEQMRCQV